jgi:hypothetical protein
MSTNTLQLFYRGTDNAVWTLWRDSDGSWTTPQSLGGAVGSNSDITAIVIPGTEILQLFYAGAGGAVSTLWRDSDGSWTTPQSLGGAAYALDYNPRVTCIVVPGTQVVQLFYVGLGDGTEGSVGLWTLWRNPDGSWSAEQSLGIPFGVPVGVGDIVNSYVTASVLPGTQNLQLFYVGGDNAVWTLWRDSDGQWSTPQSLGGTLSSKGDVITASVLPGTQTLQLFYVGTDSAVWTLWRDSDGQWSTPQKLGGAVYLETTITASAVPGTQTLQLFYVNSSDANMWTRWRDSDGSWTTAQYFTASNSLSTITAAVVP